LQQEKGLLEISGIVAGKKTCMKMEEIMAQKKKVIATVVEQKQLAPGIYDMWLKTELAGGAACGQFIGVYPEDKSNLLPRPISICEVNKAESMLRIVYRVAGEGTEEFSHYTPGKEVAILGILGNGFPVEEGKGKKAFLMGGGIGVPPIVQLAKELDAEKNEILTSDVLFTFLEDSTVLLFIYLGCIWSFSLVAASMDYSPVVVQGILTAETSLVAEYRL